MAMNGAIGTYRGRRRYAARAAGIAIAIIAMAGHSASAFDLGGRWSATQLEGGGLQRGDATRLQWSVVPDGVAYERSDNSDLIQFLDDGWNVPTQQRTPDYTNRAWWTVINNAYAQYARVSGVTLQYVPELDANGQSSGIVGDIRIGGENFNDGPGGALADNVYPDGGDMRIDTARENDGSVSGHFSEEPGLRNLVIHETGHGVGLGHTSFVNGSAKAVMEGGLRTDIWGLQFDDVYGLNRLYGDPKEQDGGNDTRETATDLGAFTTSGVLARGSSATDTVVERFDRDWLGIDGVSDIDWFRFSVSAPTEATISVTPIGPTYESHQQGVFDAAAQSDLTLDILFADTSQAPLMSLNEGGLGDAEQATDLFLPAAGDYFVRVRGRTDANQFYQLFLDLDLTAGSAFAADFNSSGGVDATDLGIWQAGFGLAGSKATGDADDNGLVDGADFLAWQREFGEASPPSTTTSNPAAATTPEPSSLLLAAGLAVGYATTIRRRRPSHSTSR